MDALRMAVVSAVNHHTNQLHTAVVLCVHAGKGASRVVQEGNRLYIIKCRRLRWQPVHNHLEFFQDLTLLHK